ncbi:4a-hydroxytetrahydrobiopterin dehydratase [soil metagenome]
MSDQAIGAAAALARLDGWRRVDGGRDAIEKSFRFANFVEAFGWMSRVAAHADAADHHPEWFNVYDRVDVTLSTHDAHGVTEKDVTLAAFMDAQAKLPNA